MKDLIISSKRIKKELIGFLACFFIGFVVNVAAVFYYKTTSIEIISSLPYIFIFASILYGIWSFLRVIVLLINRGISKIKVGNK